MDNGMTAMQNIRALLKSKSPVGVESPLANSILELFKEFSESYKDEWERIDDNERIYQGNHWDGMEASLNDNDANVPKPTTPIVTSTIENIKADMSDEFPEPVILPDDVDDEVAAKVLTEALRQEQEACGFAREYDKLTHDVLNCGWAVWEVGHDPELNRGVGGSYIRYVINKNFMCDPQVIGLQDGRACFKFDTRPLDWFEQRYPDHAPHFKGDEDLIKKDHDEFGITTSPNKPNRYRLIEAWFRIYNPESRKTEIHMVLIAGGQVLENSWETRPNGYFNHGKYPFVVVPLFPQKGSSLGLGITDLFKDSQRYSDKLDQILLLNTFRASRPRLLVQDDMVDIDEVRDFSKEVVVTKGPPDSVAKWQQANPLPSHTMAYIAQIRELIKTESGSNEQSRGNTASGVTAGTAIAALQEMSMKRSRMEARAIHYGYQEACLMQLAVMEEFDTVERDIIVTVGGQKKRLPFSDKTFRKLFHGDKEIPIGFRVSIRTSRQTRYTKLQHNELWLQMMSTLGNTVDPTIMIEGLEYEEKERLLENIRRAQAGGITNLQRQLSEATQMLQQIQQENAAYKKALAQAQNYVMQNQNLNRGASLDETQALQATQGIRNNMYDRTSAAAEELAAMGGSIPDPTVMSESM